MSGWWRAVSLNHTPWPKEAEQATELDPGNQDVLLTALSDPVCRRMLRETAEQALTANELSDRMNLPLSTTYRKLNLLCETAIVRQACRLTSDGHHSTQYRSTFGQIHISLSVSDEALLSVIHTNGMGKKANGKATTLSED